MAKRVSLKGRGADLFFGGLAPDASPPEPVPAESPAPTPRGPGTAAPVEAAPDGGADPAAVAPPPPARTRPPRRREQTRGDASDRASKLASNGNDEATVEAIRKIVKTLGREVSFVRLTPAEKGELADVAYAFKRQGVKTTENEINRIAINLLLADHRANGEASVLSRVLAALRA